jgi:hypothetical protein
MNDSEKNEFYTNAMGKLEFYKQIETVLNSLITQQVNVDIKGKIIFDDTLISITDASTKNVLDNIVYLHILQKKIIILYNPIFGETYTITPKCTYRIYKKIME